MGKRDRREILELPLFDLPLHPQDPPEPGTASSKAEAAEIPEIEGTQASLSLVDTDTVETPEDGPAAENELRAGVPGRSIAGLLDLGLNIAALGGAVAGSHLLGARLTAADWPPFAALAVLFSFYYWVLPLAFWCRTPGMAVVRHQARQSDGSPLTFAQAGRRWLGAGLTVALAGLPMCLPVALGKGSLSDWLSASKTVRQARGTQATE